MNRGVATFLVIAIVALRPLALYAAITLDTAKNVAFIVCGNRRGTGVVTDAAEGYIVTNGHVAIDVTTGVAETSCQATFVVDDTFVPKARYEASVVDAVFDARLDLDFALLKIGAKISGPTAQYVGVATGEFARVGDPIAVYGYPGSASSLTETAGNIDAFNRGYIDTHTQISKGVSGAPAFDAAGRLVGVATRILTRTTSTGEEEVVTYQLGDVLSLLAWLDWHGAAAHDAYVNHADHFAYHALPYVTRDEGLGCQDLARTALSPTVYCLQAGSTRLVFPNEATYFSWYPDFSGVKNISLESIAQFRLIGNVTMKAHSLVKIQTDPKVYVVSDSRGTLHWVQSETKVRQLFGDTWAKKVRDVPDSFFADYRVGEPVAE